MPRGFCDGFQVPANAFGALAGRDGIGDVLAPSDKVVSLWRLLSGRNHFRFAEGTTKMYQAHAALHADGLKILCLFCRVKRRCASQEG